MRYAIIDGNNMVVNVVMYTGDNGPWSPPDGCIMIQSDTANIGNTYDPDGKKFTKPIVL